MEIKAREIRSRIHQFHEKNIHLILGFNENEIAANINHFVIIEYA